MIAFVFCFFFMEETNYVRRTIGVVEFNNEDSPSRTEIEGHIRDKPSEKTADAADARALEINTGENYRKKTFWSKLRMLDKPKPNLVLLRARRPLIFLSFPVVFYCGFAYGFAVVIFTS
jgi:hypothetical protein